jgi:DNA invertase Pin-like site-specific DNA recombinase
MTKQRMLRTMKTAVAYYRTSSSANVGQDKDSEARQQFACRNYAAHAGLEIVHEYYDAAVSGTDPVDSRPGFCEMIQYMLGNGARIILVETANRFARDLMVQEIGCKMLKDKGITLIAVDSPESFVSDTPTAIMIRQILGSVAQFEKAMLVSKLRGARDRKRRTAGRCEGRKPASQATKMLANTLRAQGLTLRTIARELASAGYLAPSGRIYGPGSVAAMLSDAPAETNTPTQ